MYLQANTLSRCAVRMGGVVLSRLTMLYLTPANFLALRHKRATRDFNSVVGQNVFCCPVSPRTPGATRFDASYMPATKTTGTCPQPGACRVEQHLWRFCAHFYVKRRPTQTYYTIISRPCKTPDTAYASGLRRLVCGLPTWQFALSVQSPQRFVHHG